MRNIFPLMIATIFFSSCKKDIEACKNYKEITGREQAADITALTSKEVLDTLAKYPQLVPYRVSDNASAASISCHVYYKDLLIFSDEYDLNKEYWWHDTITSSGTILDTDPGISLEPAVNYKNAIKEAKKHINFDHTCIAYQLGLYNINPWNLNTPAEYRLAWKIMDSQSSYVYVIMDAVTNQVLISANGIIWD